MNENGNGQPDRIDEIMNLLVGFIDETRQFVVEQKQFNDEQKRFNDEQRQFNAQVTEDIKRLNVDVDQLKRLVDDVAQLKGFHVRAVAMERTASIAKRLGLTEFHVLTPEEVGTLANRLGMQPDSGVEENDRLSFAAADLVIEAHDEGRTKHYIAAEISYTVNRDDVRRATRNAGYLRLLTMSKCYAVAVGCEKTPDVDYAIADGSISWYPISNRAMAPA